MAERRTRNAQVPGSIPGLGCMLILIIGVTLVFSLMGCDDGSVSNEHPYLSGNITITPDTNIITGTQLTAHYTGNENVVYQWKSDDTHVGADSNEYTPDQAGSYTVTVSAAGYKSKTSAAVMVNSIDNDLLLPDDDAWITGTAPSRSGFIFQSDGAYLNVVESPVNVFQTSQGGAWFVSENALTTAPGINSNTITAYSVLNDTLTLLPGTANVVIYTRTNLKPRTEITSKPLSPTSATYADITVKLNVPVEWTIDLTDATSVGCRWGIKAIPEINFPGFAANVPPSGGSNPAYANDILKPGNKHVIEFTPTNTGEFQLKCVQMGMNICKIIVVE